MSANVCGSARRRSCRASQTTSRRRPGRSPWSSSSGSIDHDSVSERVLSTRALNRALLARQLLLERSRLPPARAIDQAGGLQTQYAPSPYVALWSRLHGFRRDALTKALEQRRIVQATMMRVTIHMASAHDFLLFIAGVKRSRQEWWVRTHRTEIEGLDMEAVSARLREHLRNGPVRAPRL